MKYLNFLNKLMKHDREGMTVVEVLFAISIFSVGMMGINSMYVQGFQIFDISRDNSDVAQILQNRMESIRSSSLSTIQSQTGTTVFTAADLGMTNLHPDTGAPFGWRAFSLTQSVTSIDSGYYQVVLEADWTNRYGADVDMIFTTRVMTGGLNDYFTRTTP